MPCLSFRLQCADKLVRQLWLNLEAAERWSLAHYMSSLSNAAFSVPAHHAFHKANQYQGCAWLYSMLTQCDACKVRLSGCRDAQPGQPLLSAGTTGRLTPLKMKLAVMTSMAAVQPKGQPSACRQVQMQSKPIPAVSVMISSHPGVVSTLYTVPLQAKFPFCQVYTAPSQATSLLYTPGTVLTFVHHAGLAWHEPGITFMTAD